LCTAAAYLHSSGANLTGLLGVRTGCLLAAEVAAAQNLQLTRSVFWQPVLDGARFLRQFLRLRVAAALMGDRRESVEELNQRLRSGEIIEVAGYEVSPLLAAGLERARLNESLSAGLGRLHWMEVVREEGQALAPASFDVVEAARGAGLTVETLTVKGEPFWSSTEIVEIPRLIAHTVSALDAA
jgi:exosortase A-associated hydrolase 2